MRHFSMKTVTFLWTACGLLASVSADEPTPGDPIVEEARNAIRRSLPFVEREGVAWMEKRKCMSCHQVSHFVWTFNEAQRRGFAVDVGKLKQWNEWSFKNSLGGNPFYRLSAASLEAVPPAELSEDERTKLQSIQNQDFVTERDFLAGVDPLLSINDLPEHRAAVLKATTKPGVSPGDSNGSGAYQILLHTGTAVAMSSPDQAVGALLEGLRRTQQSDGLWKASGQFLAMNRPQAESTEVNTMWILLALSSVENLPAPLTECRERAQAAIEKTPPGVSTESLLLRLLLADRNREAMPVETLLKSLLELQRADGGWAWRQESPNSDPLTTGEVIYGLGRLGQGLQDPPVNRAWNYLLKNQQEDGSWIVPWIAFNLENGKDHVDGDRVFNYWGSTWSLLGLLQTLPGE